MESGAVDALAKSGCFENKYGQAFLISDQRVGEIYLDLVLQQLKPLIPLVHTKMVPVGETSKSVERVSELWSWMVQNSADRNSVVIALGGGVVGDLAGFAAATFARGVRFVQIPTSLLSQVDSSVGGKVGINLPEAKNIVGAFWQPQSVLIDPMVLSTLDDANYFAGLAEVVKYGVIMDADFFQRLEEVVPLLQKRDVGVLTEVIARSCELKAEIVVEDERESGRRAILNYGHTFGHAIESTFGYGTFLHGQAIAIGMHCAAKLARELEMVDTEFVERQKALFEKLSLPTVLPDETSAKEIDQLVQAMHRDKKTRSGVLFLVLPTRIGEVKLLESPGDDLLAQTFAR